MYATPVGVSVSRSNVTSAEEHRTSWGGGGWREEVWSQQADDCLCAKCWRQGHWIMLAVFRLCICQERPAAETLFSSAQQRVAFLCLLM